MSNRFNLRIVIVGVIGLAIGALCGLAAKSTGSSAPRNEEQVSRIVRQASGTISPSRGLGSLTKRLEQHGDLPLEAARSIAGMSTEDLKARILELAQEEPVNYYSRNRWIHVLQMAARELFLREGEAAVDWALAQSSSMIRGMVYQEAVREDASYLSGIDDYLIFAPWWQSGFGEAAVNGAAMRSAEELLEVEQLGAASNGRIQDLPAGFNFGTYLSRSTSTWNSATALGILAARDPDRAAEILRNPTSMPGFEHQHLGSALDGYASVAGEEEAAKWIGKIVENLPDHPRLEEAVRFIGGTNIPDEFRARELAEHLPTDSHRVSYVATLLSHHSHRRNLASAAFEGLGMPDLQFQALQIWARDSAPRNLQYARTNLENLLAATSLAPDQRDELRAMLPEPVVEEP